MKKQKFIIFYIWKLFSMLLLLAGAFVNNYFLVCWLTYMLGSLIVAIDNMDDNKK